MNLSNSPTSSIAQKVEGILSKAYLIRTNDLSQSIELADEAISLAKNEDENLYAKAINAQAFFYMIRCRYEESIKLSNEALVYFEKHQDQLGIANAKFNIASIYYKSNRFHEGLLLLLDCKMIYRQHEDYTKEARVLKSIGTIYEFLSDADSAIHAYEECIKIAISIGKVDLESNAYNPLSGIYINQGKVKEAMAMIEKSIRLKRLTDDVRGLGFALYGRGKVYAKTGEYEKAEMDYLKSKEIHEEMGDKVGLCMTYNKLGVLYFLMNDLENARSALIMALDIATEINIIAVQYKVYYNLYQIAKKKGMMEDALKYLEKHIQTKESIIYTHTINVIKSYEAISRVDALEQEAKSQREKTEIIEQKNIELDSFFYRVSHDLKGPINSLEGLNNLIAVDIKDEVSLNYFSMYKKQIDRISKIVMELINLTRMNHQKIERQIINFNLIVDDCIGSYSHFENFDKISFIKNIDPNIKFHSEWPVINTILQNLIENSIKYWREEAENPYVKICISEEEGIVVINTSDNGMGIEPKYQTKIFDMFYRASDSIAGTGLGLYILKRAVERLNGKIALHSELGTGSKFEVRLPKQTG